MRRRTFLTGAALLGAAAFGAARRLHVEPMEPDIHYPGMAAGHALRDARALAPPRGEVRTGVVILGSGAAGLSCAWQLAREGRRDFLLVDGPEVDGNAAGADLGRAGDDVLACPLGAHYLPIPSTESSHVRALLADTGVLLAGEHSAAPEYDESALCHAPRERLLYAGRWEGDLLPTRGLDPATVAQHQRFFAEVDALRAQTGRDGRRVFALPVALSSNDDTWRALDRITFARWLDHRGYTAPHLRWYLDYCCRDDYGADTRHVSAWFGLHYFASRDGRASNASHDAVLTWPGGLSELMRRMSDAITRRLGHSKWRVPGFAARIDDRADRVDVTVARTAGDSVQVHAEHAVAAMPLHVLARVWPGLASPGEAARVSPHAAWLVSNVLVDGLPDEHPGLPLAWDNVVYGSRGLGFVVSTHQLLRVAPARRSVLTAYQPLDRLPPDAMREWLLRASPESLREAAMVDLLAAYGPDVWRHVRRLAITVRGHAMATPAPGVLDDAHLAMLRNLDGRVRIAHADLSGYSVFEEAAWWGIQAARALT